MAVRIAARARRALSPLLIYPLLALLAFPTLGNLVWQTKALAYGLDVFDDGGGLARLAIAVRDWSAHGFTLWDPYLTAGNALLGQFAISPYAPDVALAFAAGPFWAAAISTWLTASLAGIGTHLFLRWSIGLSVPAAVGGSLMAVFCFWHPIYGVSVAILPLVLWLGDRAAVDGPHRGRFTIGWIAAGALALYAGQVQVVLFVTAIQLAWLLVTRPGRRRAGLVQWLVSWGIAFGLYGPVLVTQLVMLPTSERSAWNLDYLYPGGLQALNTVLHHYASVFVGLPVVAGWNPGEARYGTLFLGGVGLVLVVVGIVCGRRDRMGIFLLALLLAIPLLDVAASLAGRWQDVLGPLKSFQFVRIRHFFPFALSGTLALGIEAIVTGSPAVYRLRTWLVLAGALGLVQLALLAVDAGAASQGNIRFQGFPGDAVWPLAVAALVIGLAGGIVVILAIARRVPSATPLLLVVGLLFVAERLSFSNSGILAGPSVTTFEDQLAITGGEAFLQRQPGIAHQRVLTFGDNANRMAFAGLRQVDGYQAILPLTYHDFFTTLTAPGLNQDPTLWAYLHYWGARTYAFRREVDPELVSLAGARWLYVRRGGTPTVPGLVERYRDADATVYENPAAFPRAFLVGAIRTMASPQAVLAALAAAPLDALRGRVYATGGDAEVLAAAVKPDVTPSTSLAGAPGLAGTATILVDDPDRVEIDVAPTRGAILVLTHTMALGWVAEVDGRNVPIETVDGAFRGVALSATARHVVFRYEPWFTAIGGVAAGLSLAALLLWVWWVGRKRSKEEPAA